MAVIDDKPEFMGAPTRPTELHKAAAKHDVAKVEQILADGAVGLHEVDALDQVSTGSE